MAVVVLEDAEVIARGLSDFSSVALPDSTVRSSSDPAGQVALEADLVVCGPSLLRALCGVRGDTDSAAATVAVIADPTRVDFTALLASGLEVIWDLRGNQASFTNAVQSALRGQAWVSDTLTTAMASDVGTQLRRGQQAADFGLTPRENEILQLMATGASNREIALRLFISQNTVKNHVRAVLDKLHAGTRTEAVMIGARAGLIEVRPGRG